MIDFEVTGHRYKAGNLPALQQVYVIRRIGPIITSIIEALSNLPKPEGPINQNVSIEGLMKMIEPIMTAFAKLSDEDAKFIIDTSLALVMREQDNGGWARIWEPRAGSVMFQDIEGIQMLAITSFVLRDTFARFSAAVPQMSQAFPQQGTTT